MDVSCDIIRDVLPLYAEDLVSDATREMVDEHLCSCDGCMKQLGILKKAAQLPLEVNTTALKRVEHTIRRRKILSVVTAVLTLLTVLFAAVAWLNVTVYLEAEDAVIDVEPQEDGSLKYTVYDYVMGHSSFGWLQEGYENECFAHTWNTTRLDYLQAMWKQWKGIPRQVQYYEDRNNWRAVGQWEDLREVPESAKEVIPMQDCHHWHLDAYTGNITEKLWGVGRTPDPVLENAAAHNLRKNFIYALCLCGAFLGASCFPVKPWGRELLRRFAILSGSVAVAQLFLTGGKFVSIYVSDEPFRTLRLTYALSVLLCLTVLFWRQLIRLNRQDRETTQQ